MSYKLLSCILHIAQHMPCICMPACFYHTAKVRRAMCIPCSRSLLLCIGARVWALVLYPFALPAMLRGMCVPQFDIAPFFAVFSGRHAVPSSVGRSS